MAEESRKHDKETQGRTHENQVSCSNQCGFFGSSAANNLCSKCYKDLVLNQARARSANAAAVDTESVTPNSSAVAESSNLEQAASTGLVKPGQPEIKRCSNSLCRKRLRLTGIECRCGNTYCSNCRYADKHNCSHDYKSAGRDAIARANPEVKAEKVRKSF